MSSKTLVAALAMTLLLVTPGTAAAQDAGAVGTVDQSATLSAKEKITFAQGSLDEMREASAYVTGLLTVAEPEQDVVKIQCLKKKLAAIGALIQVSESAMETMKEALAMGEDGRADYEFRKIGVAVGKARQFRAESDVCVGSEGQPETRTTVDYEGAELEEVIEDGNTGIGTDPPGTSPFE